MRLIANLISYIFHPLWMPVYIFFLAVNTDPYLYAFFPRELMGMFVLILAINVVAPGVSILFMKKKGLISDLDVSNRKERFAPYLLVLMYYAISYFMLRRTGIPIPTAVLSMFMSIIIILVVSLSINAYWKISVHTMATGGLVGTFLAFFYLHGYSNALLLSALIIVAALVAASRVYLGKHTLSQVYAGFAGGLILSFLAISGSWVI
jgi:membrane-associated phospholipid phosphatase